MRDLLRALRLGGSTTVLAAAASLLSNAAIAAAPPLPIEEIVITGTSIRGLAPVGSTLITVDLDAIQSTSAQTVAQIMSNIPALTSFGNISQGQLAGSSYYAPNIHQLGSSASTSTLVLIDGHRIPLGANGHDQADPNIIPTSALERVEVLADGSSSIYGSDAVAGVVNFITRRRYDGAEIAGQFGFAPGYKTYSASLIWGTVWDSGSVMIAYSYSDRNALANADRPGLTNPDHRALGGTNFKSFNCSPATIQPQGSSLIWLSPTATAGTVNSTANAPCFSPFGFITADEVRNNVMSKIEYEFDDRLTVTVDMLLSNRNSHPISGNGTTSATVFQTTSQANPFYVNPPGVTATRQTVRFNFDGLLQGNTSTNAADVYYVDTSADYRINDNFRAKASLLIGHDNTYTRSRGGLCSSCVFLALNGTTNSSGSLTQSSIPGTNAILTRLPLTTANALDVWNPPETNRTSKETLAGLMKATSFSTADRLLYHARLVVDGALFDVPAGSVRMAVGAEFIRYGLIQDSTGSLNIGPSNQGATAEEYRFQRKVYAAFGELQIPVIGAANAMPMVEAFDIDLSARYDDYSDVGDTFNPKIAGNWRVFDGFELRANYSTSFVAPAMDSRGDPSQFYNAGFAGVTVISGPINVNTQFYPQAFQFPGCVAGATSCVIGSSTVQGLRYIRGGGEGLKPQEGKGWTAGAHYTPDFLPGFSIDATYFHNTFLGGVTSPNLAFAGNVPAELNLLTLYPTGATPAEIQALIANIPFTGALPVGGVFFIHNFNQQNILNLWIEGMDLTIDYSFDTSVGAFSLGVAGTRFLKYDQQVGLGGAIFSVLNTNGFNQTFPSIQTQARFNLGWEYQGFTADLFANYTGSYRNWGSNTVIPLTTDAFGTPTGGGDKVDSNLTFDFHTSYRFTEGSLNQTEVYLDVSNLTDKTPPFYNSAAGYDLYVGNPIGRVISVGLRKTW